MTRPVCVRALALLQVAALGLCCATADAGHPEPPIPGTQADPQATNQTPPPPNGQAQGNAQGAIPKPGVQPNTGQSPPTPTLQTPAQQRYGLPRNPKTGGPVDTDVTKSLSLARAIQIGLARQDQIGIAVAERDQNRALLVQARSSYYPQITPSMTYQSTLTPTYYVGSLPITVTTPQISGRAALPIYRSIQTDTRTDGILASQLIWDTGIRETKVGASRRNLFASEYNLANTRQNVILNVTQDYYSLLRDKELVRVQEETVRRAQTTLDSIVAQVEVGNAAQSDTLLPQSDLANAKVALLQAQNTAFVDEASLKNAMGVVTSVPLILSTDTVPKPNTDPDPRGLEQYVQLAYNYRMDLKQQQELINAQGYNVKAAQINAGVTVNATVTEGYQLDPNAGEERTFTVGFSYPLFDGGETRAVVRQNKSILEQDRLTLDQLQQNARLAVEQDYLTREVSRQQVVAAQVAVDAGQVNYNAALEKQRNGLINVVDVINAELLLVTAQVSQVEAIYNFYIADVALQRDIGENDPLYVPNVPAARSKRKAAPGAQAMLTAPTEAAPDPAAKSASVASAGAPSGDTTAKKP